MRLLPCLLAASFALPSTLSGQPYAATLPAASASVDQREKALKTLFADDWEQVLKDSPELAASIGDKRYDDQLSDDSETHHHDVTAEWNVRIQNTVIGGVKVWEKDANFFVLHLRETNDALLVYDGVPAVRRRRGGDHPRPRLAGAGTPGGINGRPGSGQRERAERPGGGVA